LVPGILIAVRLRLHAGLPCAFLRFQQWLGIRVFQRHPFAQNSVFLVPISSSPAISAPFSRGRLSAVRIINFYGWPPPASLGRRLERPVRYF